MYIPHTNMAITLEMSTNHFLCFLSSLENEYRTRSLSRHTCIPISSAKDVISA